MNKNLLYLLTILEAIEKIKIYSTEIHSADELFNLNKQKEFNAILNLLIAIGEETKKIDQSIKSTNNNEDWLAIVDLRNKLSHDYRGVDPDIVWDIITNYLEPLKIACIEIVKKVQPDKALLQKFLSSKYYQNIKYLEELIQI